MPTLRTFEDLMALDLGDRYYVHVVRKEPKVYGGARCDGVQKPIRRKMTSEEFARTYGGLEYELTPTPAQFNPMTGHPIARALSRPIRVAVPGCPPNLQMAIGYDDEEDSLRPVSAPSTRSAINADARMYDASWFEDQRTERNKSEAGHRCRDCARHRAAIRREVDLRGQLAESKALAASLLRAVADALAPKESND
jgi:hypothetical protein